MAEVVQRMGEKKTHASSPFGQSSDRLNGPQHRENSHVFIAIFMGSLHS